MAKRRSSLVLKFKDKTNTVIFGCRRLSAELETALAASKELEERLRLNLETSMKTEEEFEARTQQLTNSITILGRKHIHRTAR